MREAFGALFDVPTGYVNTASIGVPPAEALRAVREAVGDWGCGRTEPGDFDTAVATARAAFAELVGTRPEHVAIGATASQLVGMVAASLPDRSSVLLAEGDFTSVGFPFAAQRERGVQVGEVPLERLGEHAAQHDLVAVSAVQSRDGSVADLAALRAARRSGTRVLLDVTQAAGWMPLGLDWADWVVAAGYKWLLSPRGAAWMAVHPDAPALLPHNANWYAAEDPAEALYGLPLRLAAGARGLDLSPVWLAHVGAGAALSWLAGQDRTAVAEHCVGLANRLRSALEMPPGDSAIVSVRRPDAGRRLEEAGVRASVRQGGARLAFHLYNTAEDVDLAARALRG
ncbi:aminotransferase class V-fold PLP-dependent enzyme [Salinifilum aidingensis]